MVHRFCWKSDFWLISSVCSSGGTLLGFFTRLKSQTGRCPVGPQSISHFQLDKKPRVSCLFGFFWIWCDIWQKKRQKRALYVFKKTNSLIWHFYSENWRFKWVKEKWKVFQCPSSVLNAFSLLIGRLTHRCFTGGRVSGLIVQHIEL